MMSLKISWENFIDDLRSADVRLVLWTQILLTTFLLTLTLTSTSIQQYLDDNLENLLGSDMVISRYHPLTDEQKNKLLETSEQLSQTQLFDVTVTHKKNWQRVQLKMVDQHYPIQGQISIGREILGQHININHGPELGEIWLDSRVVTHLKIKLGERVEIGDSQLKFTAIIYHEPDRLMEGHSVALRAMVHQATFYSTNIVGVTPHFRYLIKANTEKQTQIKQWVLDNIPDAHLITQENGEHPLALFWKRVESFIGLASVLLFFMAAIALDLVGSRQIERQKYKLALFMSMGLEKNQGMVIALGQWFFGFWVSFIPAITVAYIAEWFLVGHLQNQFQGIQFGWHITEATITAILIMALLLCFQIPGLIQLFKTSISSLICKQQTANLLFVRFVWSFSALVFLAAIYSDNMLLTSMTLGAMIFSIMLMMIITYMLLAGGELLTRHLSGLLPFTFFAMKQRLLSKSTQILGIGLCATLLLFSLMLIKDIGESMERNTRSQDGNLLITEAHSSHIAGIEKWNLKTGSQVRQIAPYTHAQLVTVNGELLADYAGKPSDSLATLMKPIRLSWSENIPLNNLVSEGQWWNQEDINQRQISVEREVMIDTGIKIGDWLSFQLNGRVEDFEVVAGHDFKSGHGSITFWFQVPPKAISNIDPEVYFMGSMELPPEAWPKLISLWQDYPTLSLLPLKEMTERFDQTLEVVKKLLLGFSGMIMVMALIVIVASVKGFERADQKKNGLLLSMGLSRWDCIRHSLYEWIITALIAGIGAISGTWLAGVLIYQSQFSMRYQPDVLWIITTLLIVAVIVCCLGLFYCRTSLKASISQLLSD